MYVFLIISQYHRAQDFLGDLRSCKAGSGKASVVKENFFSFLLEFLTGLIIKLI